MKIKKTNVIIVFVIIILIILTLNFAIGGNSETSKSKVKKDNAVSLNEKNIIENIDIENKVEENKDLKIAEEKEDINVENTKSIDKDNDNNRETISGENKKTNKMVQDKKDIIDNNKIDESANTILEEKKEVINNETINGQEEKTNKDKENKQEQVESSDDKNTIIESSTEEKKEEAINIEKISYEKNIIKMVVGETIELNPTISPSNATEKELVYSSSNPNMVSVDEDGKVTALKTSLNPTFIYIKSKNNLDISFSIRVYVFDDIRIDSLKFQKDEETVDIATNGIIYKFKINAPINAMDYSKYTYCGLWMEYTSSDPSVARVQVSNIDTLYLNKPGTTIITAKYRDGKTAQMTLHVVNSSDDQRTTDEKLKYTIDKSE